MEDWRRRAIRAIEATEDDEASNEAAISALEYHRRLMAYLEARRKDGSDQ